MDETIKEWLRNLFDREIEEVKKTISNERILELGCSDEYNPHTKNIELNEKYLEILENLKHQPLEY